MSRYPDAAYRRLFPGEHTTSAGESLPFAPAEDGDHYQAEPNFFEWWYFDAGFEDGSHLVAIFHSSLYNMADHKPMIELRYYLPERPSITAMGRFDRTTYRAVSNRCQVKIGDCLAVDEGDHYQLSLRQGPLAAELTFWPMLPGWKAGTGHLFADPVSGRYFDWVVPLPRARVEGVLILDAQRQDVAGTGYHDHNWGNLYLPSAFRRWTWGRVLVGDWTLIFGDVVGRGTTPSRVTPFMLARGDEILLATDRIRVNGKALVREPYTGADYYRHLRLTTVEGPEVTLTLKTRRTIEALEFAAPHLLLARQRHIRRAAEIGFYLVMGKPVVGRLAAWLLGKGAYLRCEADYRLDLPDYASVETGQALYEVMLL